MLFCVFCFLDGEAVISPFRPRSVMFWARPGPYVSPIAWMAHTGQWNYSVVTNAKLSNEPWLVFSSTCRPLAAHVYAVVFAVMASTETDDAPIWSGLLPPTARAIAL